MQAAAHADHPLSTLLQWSLRGLSIYGHLQSSYQLCIQACQVGDSHVWDNHAYLLGCGMCRLHLPVDCCHGLSEA